MLNTNLEVKSAADYLSRHVPDASYRQQEKYTEEYISFAKHTSVSKAMTTEEIASATNNYRTLQCFVRTAIPAGTWDSPALKRVRPVKEEITVGTQNIVLCGHRIVIPVSLRQCAIDNAHEQHEGISRQKLPIKREYMGSRNR